MSHGLLSDEVAEDYKNSLEDLNMNSRYEISNLTVIAKENLDHAMAIARVLENHINTTAPPKKLPALYVLDSVVKNVGTPYTLFFGQNLYRTFMDAYTLVDGQVRRKLEEMLKTWKEPVPGSIDTNPVFPPDVTRRIDNALIKARTAAVQLEQQRMRSQQHLLPRRPGTNTPPVPNQGWRPSPTPPRSGPSYGQPDTNTYPQAIASPGPDGAYRSYHPPNPNVLDQQRYLTPQPHQNQNQMYSQPTSSIDTLNRDIDGLIERAQSEFALDPYSLELQGRLKALLQLKDIVQNQQLPYDQLQQIKEQVALISRGNQTSAPPPPQMRHDPPYYPPQPPPHIASQVPEPPPQFAPGALAALLSSTAIQRNTATPPQTIATPSFQQNPAAPNSNAAPSSLLDSLRASGLLPPSSSTPLADLSASLSQNPLLANSSLLSSLTARPAANFLPARPALAEIRNLAKLKSSTLKEPHPELIGLLYEKRPSQCTTCGRRFLTTDEDKKKKARHLDWHFKINQRMVEAAKRGQSRSWYLDEREWIRYRESLEEEDKDSLSTGGTVNGGVQGGSAAKNPKERWIRVPDDPVLASAHCPICQENFDNDKMWLDEAQEWVWKNAVQVGGRIYHADCHEEATKDRESTPARNGTPEPLLGKRKADADLIDPIAKVKRESAV